MTNSQIDCRDDDQQVVCSFLVLSSEGSALSLYSVGQNSLFILRRLILFLYALCAVLLRQSTEFKGVASV